MVSTDNPVVDLSLMREQTFATSILGGHKEKGKGAC